MIDISSISTKLGAASRVRMQHSLAPLNLKEAMKGLDAVRRGLRRGLITL